MPGFHKIAASNKFHITSWFHKLENDSKWHPIRNVFYKTTADDKWHPVWLYEWAASAWSACTAACDGGTQSRTVNCVRSDTLIVHDSFCNAATKPPVSQVCNTQPCNINLYTSVDDWGYFTPSDSSGAVRGNTVAIGGCFANKTYMTTCMYSYPRAPVDGGYYYYIIRVHDVHNKGGNVGFFARASNGNVFSLIRTNFGSFEFFPNGFSNSGWNHQGPWFRCWSGTNEGLFRIPAF